MLLEGIPGFVKIFRRFKYMSKLVVIPAIEGGKKAILHYMASLRTTWVTELHEMSQKINSM